MENSTENRRFPRSHEATRVRLFKRDEQHHFEAYVETADVSFGGAFFTSHFFLKPGLELDVEFTLPHDERVIHARGLIVREVRVAHGETETGFAVRFTRYFGDAKSILATYFLHFDLDDFLDDYLTNRQRRAPTEKESMREALIAWEIFKMELNDSEIRFVTSVAEHASSQPPVRKK